ncbi:CsiV family protein [Atopomonas sediminilitoris]|uniref:CsiV family protein n=1 Tax=Atopomonas sediminilitoris TaxID=2919919 RepID=UPI001F4EFC0B|nr:CsiV family protein [Atopomonas sediminilitoris]MCJ8167723.1 peptidoglycan binding protein CsiV [Atopomonas sediminilitoris]
MKDLTVMPLLRNLLLLLTLTCAPAMAQSLYQIEVLAFRQAQPLLASQPVNDAWADGAQAVQPEASMTPMLVQEAERLSSPANGYELLMQQSWKQTVTEQPVSVTIGQGDSQDGHQPVELKLDLRKQNYIDAGVDLWVNHFGEDGLLMASERLKQERRISYKELNYFDHGSIGLLIRVTPL